MKDKLKVIDGSKDRFAPPPHHGLIRAIYDTVDACGGANLAQIKKYLPAAIDNIGQVLRKKRLQRALYTCVYRGYLIHDDTRKPAYWQIAPMEYYEKRHAYCKDMEARSAAKGDAGKLRGEYVKTSAHSQHLTIRISRVLLHRVASALAIIAVFVLGAVLGEDAMRPPRADFTYRVKRDGVVHIYDRNLGNMSVTNDAEQVLWAIHEGIDLTDRKVQYTDSEGQVDRLIQENGVFKRFAPGSWS